MLFNYNCLENSKQIKDFHIVCQTADETFQTAKHFRLVDLDNPVGIIQCASMLRSASGKKHTKIKVPETEKRPWFLVAGQTKPNFVEAYHTLLTKLTGQTLTLPELNLTDHHPRRVSHTHITRNCVLDSSGYHYAIFIQSEYWVGKSAEERAIESALDYAEEDISYRPIEPEFIQDDRNHVKRNPNYLKRRRSLPVATRNWVWLPIWDWWVENHATPGQKDFVRRKKEEVAKNPGLGNSFGWELPGWPPTGNVTGSYLYLDNYREQYTWEQFRNM